MHLFSREVGNGDHTIIILHGLYGASDNWMTIASSLSEEFRIILPDQRNHGRSAHHPEHTYEAMALDLLELINEKGLQKVTLIGHSMGGKTVMRFALDHPKMIDHLIIIDIVPKNYRTVSNFIENTNIHHIILDAMSSVDPTKKENRTDIDEELEKLLPNKPLRQFLMKNIRRSSDGSYQWQLNLEALKNNLPEIMDGFSKYENQNNFTGVDIHTLFIKGETSPYIGNEDLLTIRHFFPNSQTVTIANSGHWLHAEQPDKLIKTILNFIS